MEEHFFEIARFVALAIEAVAVLVLAIATVVAVARLGRMIVAGETTLSIRRDVWLRYGAAIALALMALGALTVWLLETRVGRVGAKPADTRPALDVRQG
jgi:hypothetical protein